MKTNAQEKPEVDLICPDCGTDLTRDRFEYVCPSDGHRFVVKDGQLALPQRHLSGLGPDGTPCRRRYPSLDGGMACRTVEPKDRTPRSFDARDDEARRARERPAR